MIEGEEEEKKVEGKNMVTVLPGWGLEDGGCWGLGCGVGVQSLGMTFQVLGF